MTPLCFIVTSFLTAIASLSCFAKGDMTDAGIYTIAAALFALGSKEGR